MVLGKDGGSRDADAAPEVEHWVTIVEQRHQLG
jgi:hypothetical protein